MYRKLRNKKEFSPFDLVITHTPPPAATFACFSTGVSLQDDLTQSLAADTVRSDRREGVDDVDGDWEDDESDDSVETHSLSSSSLPSRCPTPQPGPSSIPDVPPSLPSIPPSIPPSPPSIPSPPSSPLQPAADEPIPTPPKTHAQLRKAEYKRLNRKRKRQEEAIVRGVYGRIPLAKYSQEHRRLPSETTTFSAEDFRTAATGSWTGPRERRVFTAGTSGGKKRRGARPRIIRKLRELDELLAEGYRYIKWDGK